MASTPYRAAWLAMTRGHASVAQPPFAHARLDCRLRSARPMRRPTITILDFIRRRPFHSSSGAVGDWSAIRLHYLRRFADARAAARSRRTRHCGWPRRSQPGRRRAPGLSRRFHHRWRCREAGALRRGRITPTRRGQAWRGGRKKHDISMSPRSRETTRSSRACARCPRRYR